jgi:hypothetical protein
MLWAKIAPMLAAAVRTKARQHDRASPEPIRQRPERELRHREPDQIERDRQLHRAGIGGEYGDQRRERRHQDVQRQRADRRHGDQERDQPAGRVRLRRRDA